MKWVIIFLLSLTFVAFYSPTASAQETATFAIDAIYSSYKEEIEGGITTEGSSLRSTFRLALQSPQLNYGVFYHHEAPSKNTKETLLGGMVGIGQDIFLELGAGILNRDFSSYEEKGWGIIFKPGVHFTTQYKFRVRLTLPFIYKKITDGIADKTILQYVPYVGVEFVL